ncbi:MAG: hypothetical protein DWQ51_04835 [Microcystis wesenbergii TW10]|uniref:Uncharacterized protein n=2 Tax=Microcystis TaxID=1125 RepID=A0A552AQ02_MICAE|nr:MAG: hypothetical protein DWQ51_04835 [Microcystis wesenbergii TW10]TRT87551.1 MAG: hypothetical protein EWV63_08390 [Microcystis aeruginosa Ma_OC_H_19870700_S124]
MLVKTEPECRSWEQGEEVLAFVLKFPICSLNAVQLRENLAALTITLQQVVILTGCLPFHSLKVPWPLFKPRDF